MITPIEEQELREALDNVWGLLPLEQVNDLDPGTIHACRHNHWLLHHQDAAESQKEQS